MIHVKNLTGTPKNWVTFHSSNTSAPETDFLSLSTTAATADAIDMWNDTAPTSSVFTIGTHDGVNQNTQNYIAYLWAEVDGFSKFGSYTGNGSTDGPFIWCGFRPAFVMFKKTSSTSNWEIRDSARSLNNPANKDLYTDGTFAESSATDREVDLLSNGFKHRNDKASLNSSADYIFMAFAESPFKTARAR